MSLAAMQEVKVENQEDARMRRRGQLLSQFLHPPLVGFLSFVSLTLILGLFSTLAYCSEVTLAWDPNTEPELAGYKVYYKTKSSGPPYNGTGPPEGDSPIDVGNVTEFTLDGLSNGVIYFFAVTAYDTEGYETYYSNEVSTSELSVFDSAGEAGGGCFIAAAAGSSNIDVLGTPGPVSYGARAVQNERRFRTPGNCRSSKEPAHAKKFFNFDREVQRVIPIDP
jgi:hypothetical protein